MKSAIITIVLGTALLLFAPIQSGGVLAMGAKGDAAPSLDTKAGESQPEKFQGRQTEDALASKESATRSREKSPEKQPRLKYRDEPGCSC